jgi:hypothetical protein
MKYTQAEVEYLTNQFFSVPPELSFTKSGEIVIIVTKSGGGYYPIIGAYYNGEYWVPSCWLADGRYGSINDSMTHTGLDLLLIQPSKA